MPKSRRTTPFRGQDVVKQGRVRKENLVDGIRQSLEKYSTVFVFRFDNMRTTHMKDVRIAFRSSRFFMGKNKVMQLALGKTRADEQQDNLRKLSKRITGSCGLLFTNESVEKTIDFFQDYRVADYARSGLKATKMVELAAGALEHVPASMVTLMTKLGLPAELRKGVVTITKDHTICKEGDTLTPEQARALKMFGHSLAEFRVYLDCFWQDGKFALIESGKVRLPTADDDKDDDDDNNNNNNNSSSSSNEEEVEEDQEAGEDSAEADEPMSDS